MTAAACDIFHLGAAYSSDSETETLIGGFRPTAPSVSIHSSTGRTPAATRWCLRATHKACACRVQAQAPLVHGRILPERWRGGGGKKDRGSGVFQDVATLARATFGQVARAALPSPSSPPRCAQQAACFCSWPRCVFPGEMNYFFVCSANAPSASLPY